MQPFVSIRRVRNIIREGAIKGLRDGLKEAGYIEGKNLVLDIQAKQSYDELRPIAKAYAEKKFDVIATNSGTVTLIAKELTTTIPIVFVGGVADPSGFCEVRKSLSAFAGGPAVSYLPVS